jgi:aryl-alcohol dehydrogenase-like predicted oxidoreductase
MTCLRELYDAGFTTFDVADIYGPAEDFVGALGRLLALDRRAPPEILTKWVPEPGSMTRAVVAAAVDAARARLGMGRIDLLQLHWPDYRDPRFYDALCHLADLRAEGKIHSLGLTNFDTEHLLAVIDRGTPIASNQVALSLVDRRCLRSMAQASAQTNVRLLAYGCLCGGLLSARFLGRAPPSAAERANPSLRKYLAVIERWGGWSLFQALLEAMAMIGRRRGATIAQVAVRWVLLQPGVAAAILGTQLRSAAHPRENAQGLRTRLEPEDLALLDDIHEQGHDLLESLGDCGAEYRRS